VDNASIQTKVSMQVELVDRKPTATSGIALWSAKNRSAARVSRMLCSRSTGTYSTWHVVSETAAEIDKFLAAPR